MNTERDGFLLSDPWNVSVVEYLVPESP